jgi:hypothetical protein
MTRLHQLPLFCTLTLLPLTLLGGACSSSLAPPDGLCSLDQAVDCGVSLDGGAEEIVGLSGYSCSGTVRPDDAARYDEGVPEGRVCADRGPTADGKQSYCCSPSATPCAYDPVASCDSGTFGYQCLGASRPEAFDAAITCGNGVVASDYIDYCCSGQTQPDGCTQVSSGCSDRLTGFTCPSGALPKGEDLGSSESRADYYRLLCPIPTPAANVKFDNYCCYMPALVPVGASCVQDTTVPGCAPGRFGFACYGPDTPDQDYPSMQCPGRGAPGKSAEGYPATLYCCDFT